MEKRQKLMLTHYEKYSGDKTHFPIELLADDGGSVPVTVQDVLAHITPIAEVFEEMKTDTYKVEGPTNVVRAFVRSWHGDVLHIESSAFISAMRFVDWAGSEDDRSMLMKLLDQYVEDVEDAEDGPFKKERTKDEQREAVELIVASYRYNCTRPMMYHILTDDAILEFDRPEDLQPCIEDLLYCQGKRSSLRWLFELTCLGAVSPDAFTSNCGTYVRQRSKAVLKAMLPHLAATDKEEGAELYARLPDTYKLIYLTKVLQALSVSVERED